MASPGHGPYPDSDNVSFLCSVASSNETADDLPGPGRVLGNLYGFAGRHLEVFLGKAAERMGKGPRVTAERIRRRRAIIIHASQHGDSKYFWGCHPCNIAQINAKKLSQSPASIRAKGEKIEKDCKQLLKYVKSKVASTQKQAMDYILDLSADDDYVRALLKTMGATKIITDSVQIYSEFRYSDFDSILLTSSRKALVSLGDAEINTLLQKWITVVLDDALLDERIVNSLWHKIAPYLDDPETSFLVVRTLRRERERLNWSEFTGFPDILGCVISSITKSPHNCEWEEVDALLDHMHMAGPGCPKVDRKILEFQFRFLDRLPVGPTGDPEQPLWITVNDKEPDEVILNLIFMNIALISTMGVDEHNLQDLVVYPVFGSLVCPLEVTLIKFFGDCEEICMSVPTPAEFHVYSEITRYVDSMDSTLQQKAWNYINFFLAYDTYRCDMMLQALSTTNFAATGEFSNFVKTKRKQCIPKTSEERIAICRHLDRDYNQIHLNEVVYPYCRCENLKEEEMTLPSRDRRLDLRVKRGTTFSSAGLHPLVAGYGADGKRSFVASLQFKLFHCTKGCRRPWYVGEMLSAVTEGTKPDDLRIEIHCLHRTAIVVPDSFSVFVLRYAPDAYPKTPGVDEEGLDATGPFSWRSAAKYNSDSYKDKIWAKVLTADEATRNAQMLAEGQQSLENEGQTRLSAGSGSCSSDPLPCDEKGQTETIAAWGPNNWALSPYDGCSESEDDPAPDGSSIGRLGGHDYDSESDEVVSLSCGGVVKAKAGSGESLSGSLPRNRADRTEIDRKSSDVDSPTCNEVTGSGDELASEGSDMDELEGYGFHSGTKEAKIEPWDEADDIETEPEESDIKSFPGDEAVQTDPDIKSDNIHLLTCDEGIETGFDSASDEPVADEPGAQVIVSSSPSSWVSSQISTWHSLLSQLLVKYFFLCRVLLLFVLSESDGSLYSFFVCLVHPVCRCKNINRSIAKRQRWEAQPLSLFCTRLRELCSGIFTCSVHGIRWRLLKEDKNSKFCTCRCLAVLCFIHQIIRQVIWTYNVRVWRVHIRESQIK